MWAGQKMRDAPMHHKIDTRNLRCILQSIISLYVYFQQISRVDTNRMVSWLLEKEKVVTKSVKITYLKSGHNNLVTFYLGLRWDDCMNFIKTPDKTSKIFL